MTHELEGRNLLLVRGGYIWQQEGAFPPLADQRSAEELAKIVEEANTW